jgi:hypothetical protein
MDCPRVAGVACDSGPRTTLRDSMERAVMTTRTCRKLMTFEEPFLLRAIDAVLPPGTYKIDIDEESIDGLSFLAYRRAATWIHLPSIATKSGTSQMILVQPSELGAGYELRPASEHGA